MPQSSPAKPKSDWPALAAQIATNPLLVLPADARAAVARLWACNGHLFPSAAPLACTVRDYLDTQEVTAGDIGDICARLLLPDVRARQRGSWDVIADLSRFVAEAAARNKSRREADERRRAADEFEAARPAVPLGDLFKMPD